MKCYVCGNEAIQRHGRSNMCEVHVRFKQMQKTATQDKKYVPSMYELEKLVPSDMCCQDCGQIMHWIDDNNRPAGAVLQHYRDGSLGIVCASCNAKHGQMLGDSYRDLPAGHKYCSSCKTIKPRLMFHVRRDAKKEYPMSKCKQCCLEAHRQWRVKNPEKYIASNKKHNDARKFKKEKVIG